MEITSTTRLCQAHAPIGFRRRLWAALQLRAERETLRRLTNAELNDIGVSHAQAQAEANRPIWDAPPHWHGKI